MFDLSVAATSMGSTHAGAGAHREREPSPEPAPTSAGADGQESFPPHIYRTMRHDGSDLVWQPHKAYQYNKSDHALREIALDAVGSGSRKRSPFLSACKSHLAASRWYAMARARAGADELLMVRICVRTVGLKNLIEAILAPQNGVVPALLGPTTIIHPTSKHNMNIPNKLTIK